MALWGKKKNDPSAEHFKGVEAFESGKLVVAKMRFSKAIEFEPNSERYYFRGVINDIMGDKRAALADLKKATSHDPNNSQAWYSLSIIFGQSENIESAYNSVKRAYEIDSDDFRIVNHFAMLMLTSPIGEHQDATRAVELSKHACELTNWEDKICLATHKQALAAVGETSASQDVTEHLEHTAGTEDKHFVTNVELTEEIISHFEKRFKQKTNELALQNILPPTSAPTAVQTIESKNGRGPSVIFTTGLSNRSLMVSKEDEGYRFIELLMIIPGDWKAPKKIDKSIWPWHSLQQLAYLPQSKGGYTRHPQVVKTTPEAEPFDETGFNSFLLLPGLKGYVGKLVSKEEKEIRFVTAVPLYPEEYMLAQMQGADVLFKRFQSTKTKPHLVTGRKNLGVE